MLNFRVAIFFFRGNAFEGLSAAVIRTGCDPALRERDKKRTTDGDWCYLDLL